MIRDQVFSGKLISSFAHSSSSNLTQMIFSSWLNVKYISSTTLVQILSLGIEYCLNSFFELSARVYSVLNVAYLSMSGNRVLRLLDKQRYDENQVSIKKLSFLPLMTSLA